jgi:hypothetical protein
MKYSNFLSKLQEASDPKERLNARLRKRRQRSREQEIKQTNPFQMVLIVKNKMNGEILIIDKESYTPKYHEIIVPPEKINQAIINDIIKDPKFIQTETSKRILGDIKAEQQPTQEKEQPAGAGGPSAVDGQAQQAAVAPPMPKQEPPFTQANVSSGPLIALGMMGGMRSGDLLKMGISEDQLSEFNSSQEIQQVSMKLAKDIAFYFKSIVGRDILEYSPFTVKGQMFQTTDFWRQMGGTDMSPKSELVFRHKCVDESMKNKDKKCAETMCGCGEAGIVPSEQMPTFTMKFGPSSITSGKINNESRTTLYAVISFIDSLMAGSADQYIMAQFGEKEKDALEKLKDDIKFIKKISTAYIQENLINNTELRNTKQKLEKIDKLAQSIHEKIERIINSNILYTEMFMYEALTGYLKFGNSTPAYAKYMIGILPTDYTVSMDEINLQYIKKITSKDVKFVINMKSQIDQSADEKSDLEACKIRNGGKCPKIFNPDKFAIRQLISSYLVEKNYFKYSKLQYLIEKTDPAEMQDIFLQNIEDAVGLMDLMNIFAVTADQITIGQIDFYDVTSTTYSAQRNIIRVNGKMFKIPVQMDPIPVSDLEQITEDLDDPSGKGTKKVLPKKKLIKKPRNYKKEQKYESTPEQKARRAARGRARYKLAKLKLVRKGDKRDVDHRNKNTEDDTVGNLQIMSASANRAKH